MKDDAIVIVMYFVFVIIIFTTPLYVLYRKSSLEHEISIRCLEYTEPAKIDFCKQLLNK